MPSLSVLYDVEHVTTYNYARAVTFGAHRAMFLPRTGGRGRIITYSASTNLSSRIRWVNDVFSNVVTLIDIDEPGAELKLTFRFRGVHYGIERAETFPLEPRAEQVPVQYTPDEWTDLGAYIKPHADDPDASIAAWAKTFIADGRDRTNRVLRRVLESIGGTFDYRTRYEEGTQPPGETLRLKSGTCRDFAWLMIEALRRLGFACRFVSGYVYDAALEDGAANDAGSGSTHAWVQVYLPGGGWLNYDPTNRVTGGNELIPAAIARHPQQAVPLAGTWFGEPQDYLGMSVAISVRKLNTFLDDFEPRAPSGP